MFKVIKKQMTIADGAQLDDAIVYASTVRKFPSLFAARQWIDRSISMAWESDQAGIGTGWEDEVTAYVFMESNGGVDEYKIVVG